MSDIRVTRWSKVQHASKGFSFSHATEAGYIPLRSEAELIVDWESVKEHRNRDTANAIPVQVNFKAIALTIAIMKNFALMCMEPRKWRLQNVEGEYVHFWENTATIGTRYGGAGPNGSRWLGMDGTITITDKIREASMSLKGKMYPSELAWLISQFGTPSDGNASGGSAVGLTAMTESYTDYVPSNFTDVKLGGTSVGVFNTPKLEIKFSGQPDQYDRPYCRMASVTASVNGIERGSTQFQAALNASLTDGSVAYLTADDENFFFDSSVSSKPKISGSDKDGGITITKSGDIPISKIDWGVAVAGKVNFPLV